MHWRSCLRINISSRAPKNRFDTGWVKVGYTDDPAPGSTVGRDSGHDALKRRRSGRCFARISNRGTAPLPRALPGVRGDRYHRRRSVTSLHPDDIEDSSMTATCGPAPLPGAPAGGWHRRVWALAGPIMISNVSTPLLGAVDTAVVGRLPDAAYVGGVAVAWRWRHRV